MTQRKRLRAFKPSWLCDAGGQSAESLDLHRLNAEARFAAIAAMKDQPLNYATRSFYRQDHNFILDSWASSYRTGAASDKIPQDIYKVEQRARITRILKTAEVRCLIPEDRWEHISGWICYSPPANKVSLAILHYILVHPSCQMRGLGSQLLTHLYATKIHADDPCWCTHWTVPMRKLIPRWNLIYNPYLLESLK